MTRRAICARPCPLAARRWDLDNATHGGKLEARIKAEVAALREQRDEVRSLENQASDAEDELSSAQVRRHVDPMKPMLKALETKM